MTTKCAQCDNTACWRCANAPPTCSIHKSSCCVPMGAHGGVRVDDLKSLVGTRHIEAIGRDYAGDDSNMRVCLKIDGAVYLFTGSGDGYRSSLQEIEIIDYETYEPMPLAPVHPPLVVEIRHRDTPEYSGDGADAIYAIDERTNLAVLDLGTDNIHDWYPSFVFQWQPEGWKHWVLERDAHAERDHEASP